ncbi:MAG: hypothetical protein RMA76_11685 [Deltaproteobacteria bacterium]|jgi:hypothetical protein
MRAYVIASGTHIAPFGDPVADIPIGDATLRETQDRLFAKLGLQVVRVDSADDIPQDEDRIVTWDDVYFTRRVLKDFLKRWKRDRTVRLALPIDSTFFAQFSWHQDVDIADGLAMYRFYGAPRGQGLDAAAPLGVIYEERRIEVRVPHFVNEQGIWVHPLTSSVCLHVRHWVHVLDASRLAVQVKWVDQIVGAPWWGAWVLVKALLFRRGRMLWRVMSAANRFGRDVDVHPTARVEGAFLGDGVRVGAQALVRGSIVGAGTVIEDRANVAYSTIGADCFVSKYTLIYNSAVMDGTNAGMSMQMCLAGRRAALTPRATPTDTLGGSKIKVRVGDEFVEVPHDVLGSCFGHDTFIGPDVFVAPGRELPNGLKLYPAPGRVLAKIPEQIDPSRSYVVRDGTIE